jgi:hypothetical protein
MSRNDWESGTLILPTAAAPALKKTLREWINALHDQVRAAAVQRYREVGQGTRSVTTYRQRVDAAIYGHGPGRVPSAWQPTPGTVLPLGATREFVLACADAVLDGIGSEAQHRGGSVHQPTAADVARVVPKMTNKDNSFICNRVSGGWGEATIVFDGRTVTWSTGDGNRAVDGAHETPLAKVFFAALDGLAWTRSTGGTLTGNDEHNEEATQAGGGANYTTATYGPLGDEAKAREHQMRGFSRKQALEMVAASKQPASRSTLRSGLHW